MHPKTRRNLVLALEREAIDAARMTAYAERAARDGDPVAARTMRAIARTGLGHAVDMAELLGLVGTFQENVVASVIGDATSHGLSYATLTGEARNAGDHEVAELFRRLTADETEAAIGLLALASRPSATAVDGSPDEPARSAAPSPIERWSRRAPTVGAEVA